VLYKKGLIYRGNRIINWCPRCLTALSDEEVGPSGHGRKALPHHVSDQGDAETHRGGDHAPETMLGDVAVAVHPKDKRYTPLKGKLAILPFLRREIPIIRDDSVDPKFGTAR